MFRVNRRHPHARKRAATNVVMFVGLGALALVAWYDINGELPNRRAPSQQHTVQALNLVRADGTTFAFERDSAGWRMVRPVQAPARASRVDTLVALIDTPTDNGYAVQDVNLDSTGLAQPRVRMRLGEHLAVFFGATEPLSGRRYIQIEDRVVLLEDQHVPLIEGGLNAFADPKLIDATVESVALADSTGDAEAWENATALGVRPHQDAVPTGALSIEIESAGTTQAWSAWQDDALVALYRDGDEIHYLISQTQAAKLGISL
ncbi:MAG: hypothetical protein AAF460_06540 [Pseudomonadota bacterium]